MKDGYRVLRAVGKRISQHGDMPIRIHSNTLDFILQRCGLHFEFDKSEFREIDAVALDALRALAVHIDAR